MINLFEPNDASDILNRLQGTTFWLVIADAINLYNSEFKKSENFARDELRVTIPKNRLDKYKNALNMIDAELSKISKNN